MGYQDGLKLRFSKLDVFTALRAPVSALLGVSGEVESTLSRLGLMTVFDLAASPLFNASAEIAAAADGRGDSLMARAGRVPGSFVTAGGPTTPQALVAADVAALRDIGEALATEVKSRLQVDSVGDLGRWPQFRAARAVLDAAIPRQDSGADSASELVPRFGEYPTERHYYRCVVMDRVTPGQTVDLTIAGPIDIAPTVAADFGFRAPAVGAVLTFAQSWFAQGVTLGNLLHSVALAPGESTRIAVLDWARRTVASGQESITEAEQLTSVSTHNRAISEVQDAVANEVQTGFSKTSGTSKTGAAGGGFGLGLGPLTLGGSGSISTTTSEAESFSSSSGSRNLAASMNQRVADATQQASSSVRERRASIVKEVSEAEHESVSTRIIANYNHMHALTVQYFEVIEMYRVIVQLQQVERCLFVPMKLVEFTDEIIERFQGILADAALSRRARELLTAEFGVVSIRPVLPMRRVGTVFDRVAAMDRATTNRAALLAAAPRASVTAASGAAPAPGGTLVATGETPTVDPGTGAGSPAATPQPTDLNITNVLTWSDDEISRAARITTLNVTRPGQSDLYLPGDAELIGVTFAARVGTVALKSVDLVPQSGGSSPFTSSTAVDWGLASPVPLQEIGQIRVSSSSSSALSGTMVLQLSYRGSRFPATLPIEIAAQATGQQVCGFTSNETGPELLLHLQKNRLHYSQAIWRAMDPSSVALLLSAFSFEGSPVAEQIDPNPLMVAGNYLVFRMPGFVEAVGVPNPAADETGAALPEAIARKNWKDWLNQHGLVLGSEAATEQLLPIPTGGVFAEAVLGRSNAAEKLDATRFWNWQDSPIPLQPPEIAAIQLGSRAQPVDATPGQLSQPVLNILNPTSLPDPTGVGAILNAVQNGNLFRDMSGLTATAGLAQALSSNATTASVEAGRQAAANLAVAAQKEIEEKKIAAQMAMAAMGMPAANAGTPKNISESGALLNTAAAMDRQSPRTGPGNAGGNTSPLGGTAGGGGGTGGSGGSTGSTIDGSFMPGVPTDLAGMFSGGTAGTSRADDVLARTTFGNLGTGAGNLVMAASTGTYPSRLASQVVFLELSSIGDWPRPWPDDAAEVQGLQANTWLPSVDDFDPVGYSATSAGGRATKPYAQRFSSLEELIHTVLAFAPFLLALPPQQPAQSRVQRLNLFFYGSAAHLEFKGTLQTSGTRVSMFGPNLDIGATVLDTTVLSNVLNNPANAATLTQLQSAWSANAEIWLYCAGDVPNDALCVAFTKVMGAVVRAFDEPFWVLPTFDPATKTITTRDLVGIGSDFNAALTTKTKNLHNLDSLSTRRFP